MFHAMTCKHSCHLTNSRDDTRLKILCNDKITICPLNWGLIILNDGLWLTLGFLVCRVVSHFHVIKLQVRASRSFLKSSLLTWTLFTSWKLVITITLMWHEGSVMTRMGRWWVVKRSVSPLSLRHLTSPPFVKYFPNLPFSFSPAVVSYWCVPIFCTSPDLHTYLLTCSSFPDTSHPAHTCIHRVPAAAALCLLPTCFLFRFPNVKVRISAIGIIKHSGWVTDSFAKASSDGKI